MKVHAYRPRTVYRWECSGTCDANETVSGLDAKKRATIAAKQHTTETDSGPNDEHPTIVLRLLAVYALWGD